MDRTQQIAQLLSQQNGQCFICEKPLDASLDDVQVDHIIPRAKGGKDDMNNYAATHAWCNRNKSDSDLRVARCLAHYERIKDAVASEGPNRPNLGDFLLDAGGGKHPIRVETKDHILTYTFPELGTTRHQVPIYQDKLSGLDYVFLILPIEYLHHDSRINPRAVGPRIRQLINEFLWGKPQLHVALAWGIVDNNHLKAFMFDGQHKAVSQILLNVRQLPVRLFINPDINLLLEANTNAGTFLKQIAFDQATQRFLGSQLYWEKVDAYREVTKRSPDDLTFSEQELVNHFKGEYKEVTRYIIDDVRMSVIHNPENRLKNYIEFSGREGQKPISYSTVEKTLFSLFIRLTPMQVPLNYKVEIGENPRQLEKDQLIALCNLITEVFYENLYDFDIGANKTEDKVRKGDNVPDFHLRAVRLSREEVLYNILRYVRDLIKQYFLMRGRVIEENELFQNKFPDELWVMIRKLLRNMINLPLWINRSLSGTVFAGKQDHEYWKIIFDTGFDRAGVKVLAKPLNLNELIV